MTLYIAFDIESVINDQWHEHVKSLKIEPESKYLNETIPTRITDLKNDDLRKTRIEEYKQDLKKKQEQSVLRQRQKYLDKAALTWWSGKIICISAILSNKPQQPLVFFGENEQKIISNFFDLVLQYPQITLIGMNSSNFDIPFLTGRAMSHNLGLIPQVRRTTNVKDISDIWGWGVGASQTSSLNNYCIGLGIKTKISHGSEVQDMYNQTLLGNQEKWKEITNYCIDDSMKVLEIVSRYYKPYLSSKRAVVGDVPFGG